MAFSPMLLGGDATRSLGALPGRCIPARPSTHRQGSASSRRLWSHSVQQIHLRPARVVTPISSSSSAMRYRCGRARFAHVLVSPAWSVVRCSPPPGPARRFQQVQRHTRVRTRPFRVHAQSEILRTKLLPHIAGSPALFDARSYRSFLMRYSPPRCALDPLCAFPASPIHAGPSIGIPFLPSDNPGRALAAAHPEVFRHCSTAKRTDGTFTRCQPALLPLVVSARSSEQPARPQGAPAVTREKRCLADRGSHRETPRTRQAGTQVVRSVITGTERKRDRSLFPSSARGSCRSGKTQRE